jgi:HlyD family secretion protein
MRDLSRDIESLHIERTKSPPGRFRRQWTIAIAVAVLALLVIGGQQAISRLSRPVVSVGEIAVVSPAQSDVKLTASGYVVPMRHAVIASKQPGRLESVLVKEGDEVREGQLLATLESADLRASVNDAKAALASARARVAGAKATLAEAKLQLDRAQRLLGSGGVTQASLDSAQSRFDVAAASLQSSEADVQSAAARAANAEAALSYTRITAPFSGRIVRKMAEAGEVPTAL